MSLARTRSVYDVAGYEKVCDSLAELSDCHLELQHVHNELAKRRLAEVAKLREDHAKLQKDHDELKTRRFGEVNKLWDAEEALCKCKLRAGDAETALSQMQEDFKELEKDMAALEQDYVKIFDEKWQPEDNAGVSRKKRKRFRCDSSDEETVDEESCAEQEKLHDCLSSDDDGI